MTISIQTNIVSPHQLPLARGVVKGVGEENFRYVYTQGWDDDHKSLDWSQEVPKWCIPAGSKGAEAWLENAASLLSGLREFDLFERRAAKGLKNLYMSERWFKPPIGMLRLLHPRYFGYARRLCRMMSEGSLVGFPIGVHAASDMARLCGLMHGDLRCIFRAPKLNFERKPGGKIWLKNGGDGKRYCLDKMRMWGYFVEPSKLTNTQLTHPPTHNSSTLKVLWVGRLLNWKRIDTIIRAVGEIPKSQSSSNSNSNSNSPTHPLPHSQLTLDIYGAGPEENRLKRLATKYGNCIKFYPPVPIAEVRTLMREHDVYVLASNAYEGWGAVVSEALEEGMKVIGTYEAGSSATILPESNLFHAGDWQGLVHLLCCPTLIKSVKCWSIGDGVKNVFDP